MLRGVVLAGLTLVGCGGSTTVNVELAFDPPALIAFREGTGVWKTPKELAGGRYAAHHYSFEVSSEYELAAVWIDPDSGTPAALELEATAEDGGYWYLGLAGAYDLDGFVLEPYRSAFGFCWPPDMPSDLPGSVNVSGTVARPGRIWIDGWCTSSANPSWSYQLSVSPGVHDVIATDSMGSAFAITRGVSIAAGTMLPTVDLAATGQPLDSTTITVVNTGIAANDEVSIASQLDFFTATEGATLTSGADQLVSRSHVVPIVPASLLDPTDAQVLTISVTDNGGAHRSAITRHSTETPVFEFLSSPTISYTTETGVDAATWSAPLSPRVTAVDVHTWSFDGSGFAADETVTATARWLDAHHATSLAFDLDVAGFDPSWAIDVTQNHTTDFTVRANEGAIGYTTTQTRN